MLDLQGARKQAEAHIAYWYRCAPGDELVILDQYTRAKPYGWVFFFDSRLHLATGNRRYALAGPGPLVVDRETGSVDPAGSAQGADIMIAEFEDRRYGKRFD